MKVRFGVQVPQEGLEYSKILRYFTKLEEYGYQSAFVYDHLHPVYGSRNPMNPPVLENLVLLSALANGTDRIRIGTLVNCNSYRHPSLLAKMAASLDVISNGRLEFMIGAGAPKNKNEYRGYGIPFPPAKVRIEQMKEAIQIIRMMWTEDEVNFSGKYYNLKGGYSYPKPIQKPYPRIWVGGVDKRVLRVTAEVGEGINFWGSPKELEEKLSLLKKYCTEVGRDYDSIEKSWVGDMLIGSNKSEMQNEMKVIAALLNNRKLKGLDFEALKKSKLVGTPSDIIKKIEEFVSVGVGYFVVLLGSDLFSLKTTGMLKLFSEEVISSFS